MIKSEISPDNIGAAIDYFIYKTDFLRIVELSCRRELEDLTGETMEKGRDELLEMADEEIKLHIVALSVLIKRLQDDVGEDFDKYIPRKYRDKISGFSIQH